MTSGMTELAEHWAHILDGREYPLRITEDEQAQMRADGVVAFYSGQSYNELNARGAIYGEWCVWKTKVLIFEKGIVCAVWMDGGPFLAWRTQASVPCVPFDIIKDGKVQSGGIVLSANDLGALREEDE